MLTFPFAKINLGLHVLHRRADGFHAVETGMLPIALYDALEAVVAPELPSGTVELVRTGLPVPGPVSDDLCLKAVHLLQQRRDIPGIRLHLHKTIPTGAGLGGGSSDAAHTLSLLNALLKLELTEAELSSLAAQLGSDCPFFLQQRAQLAQGRGELLSALHVDLEPYWLLLVHPGIHVSTAWAYANARPGPSQVDLRQALAEAPSTWQGTVLNDLEEAVFAEHPEIAALKSALQRHGAVYAAMSGSGSTVFGIFPTPPGPLELPGNFSSWVLPLRGRSLQ